MNTARFISARLTTDNGSGFTAAVTKIAIISIALGLAIMLIAFAILEGFREEIQSKIVSFGGHLQLSQFDTDNNFEEEPIHRDSSIATLRAIRGISSFQPYARKTAIIKTAEEVAGIVLKGVGPEYKTSHFNQFILSGQPLSLPDTGQADEVLVSKALAEKLKLQPGSSLLFYFIQQPPRLRKLTVKGIFQTGLEEFDNTYMIGDIRLVQELNNWQPAYIGGYEVQVADFDNLEHISKQVEENMRYDLQVSKVTDIYVQLFDWLALLKRNVQIFIVLISVVATFNMVSTLFIMILERTQMIGILKALGSADSQLRSVFLWKGLQLTVIGLLAGNLLGLGFCALQYYTHIIPLDPENYYMSTVPIRWNWLAILLLNFFILSISLLAIVLPTALIARVKPVKAIRFD